MAEVAERNAIGDAAIVDLVAAFESEEIPPLERIQQLLRSVWSFNNPVPVLGTAEALVSTGDLRLVENPSTRSEITGYLARSRDYFLIPLYQHEEEHRNLMRKILILAIKSGISVSTQGGHAHRATGADVAEFLANAEAYAVAISLAGARNSMRSYRDGVTAASSELRSSLEPQISAE